MSDSVYCPTYPYAPDGTPHTIIGCGALIPDERDDEGLVDCPKCGIWFNPIEESAAVQHPATSITNHHT